MTTWSTAMSFLLAGAVLSALLTWLSIQYAHRLALLDLPGQRRSHSVPTPRGGGVGIVIAVLVGLIVASISGHSGLLGESAIVPVFLVAAVGWIDDHRGLSARIRLLVHLVAVLILYFPLFRFLEFLATGQMSGSGGASPNTTPWTTYALLSLFALTFVLLNLWFINLHNFMDGINGLLASQAIFVFVVLSWLVPGDGKIILMLCAGAVVGFLPFNFPRARIFMGDVGSGALGLLIACAVVFQLLSFQGSVFSGLIACSAFVTDATCTLLSRMLRGRRWYSAHREHLYQWLVRSGFSHARVVAFYMGWNLFIVLPVLYVINRAVRWQQGFVWMFIVYALALAVWISGKRWCLSRHRSVKKQEV